MLLKKIFGLNKKNPIQKLERIVARESANILTLKELKDLSFIPDNHLGYIIAELLFSIETKTKYKDLKLHDDIHTFIQNERGKESCKLIYNSVLDYYKGNPSLNSALHILTFVYFSRVWSAPKERLSNMVDLTLYSVYLTQIRIFTSKMIDEFLIEKISNTK